MTARIHEKCQWITIYKFQGPQVWLHSRSKKLTYLHSQAPHVFVPFPLHSGAFGTSLPQFSHFSHSTVNSNLSSVPSTLISIVLLFLAKQNFSVTFTVAFKFSVSSSTPSQVISLVFLPESVSGQFSISNLISTSSSSEELKTRTVSIMFLYC